MAKKLNSFILPDNIIQKMRAKIKEGKIKDIEVGFNLCAENEDLHDESDSIGNEYTIEFPDKCLKGEKVGVFHTHAGSPVPSIIDIYQTYNFGVNCIGSIERNRITCYVRKDKIPNKKDAENILSSIIRFEEPATHIKNLSDRRDIDIYRRWIRKRNELVKRYLYNVDID